MEPTFLSATILLIFITDPLGNIPLFIAALRRVRPERRSRVILRECTISFSVMLVFMIFGRHILAVMNLTDEILRVAGGVILFLIALKMVFPDESRQPDEEENSVEPFIVPIAIPLISGPSAMATAMLIAGSNPRRMPEWIAALALSISVTFVVFRLSTWLQKRLGEQVITALERLMGLILTAVSIEMLLHGIAAYVKTLRV
jgi:MarC family membrane protein